MYSRSQNSVSRRDRVILLGKRQRADAGNWRRNERRGRSGEKRGEEICKKLYLRSSFRNIDPRERSYTVGSRWCSGGVRRETAAAIFLYWCISKNLKRSSKRVLATCSIPRRRWRRCWAFYFCWFIGCCERKDEGSSLSCGKGRCGFFPLGRRNGRCAERERERELLSTSAKRPQRISSPFLLLLAYSICRSSDTQEVHFDIVRRLSTALAKSCSPTNEARQIFEKDQIGTCNTVIS